MTLAAHWLASRYAEGTETTVSRVSDQGKFICYFLEDGIRPWGLKIAGKTAIPTGRYKLGISHNSPLSMRYYNKYGNSWFKGLPTLEWDHPEGQPMKPKFENLRVNSGNTHEHSDGCPLTASDVVFIDGDYQAVGSIDAMQDFCLKLYAALAKGDVYLTITDHEVRL